MYAMASFDLVEVPSIEVPFEVAKADHAADAQQRHMQWADYYEVFEGEDERRKFAAMDLGSLAALLYPESASARDTQLLADWCAWLLLRDDRWDCVAESEHWEELARRDRSYSHLLRSGSSGRWPSGRWPHSADRLLREDSLYPALEDLLARLHQLGRARGVSRPVDGRFVSVMKRFFGASVREVDYQRRTEYPIVADYVQTRSATGGLDILTFVQAALDGRRLPAEYVPGRFEKRKTLFEGLTRASENICCWHNDLVSLNKEIAGGEVHNLILALLHDPASGCRSLEEAVEEAVRMVYEELASFGRLEREANLRNDARAEGIRWYARTLRQRIGGIIVWQEACAARYKHAVASSQKGR